MKRPTRWEELREALARLAEIFRAWTCDHLGHVWEHQVSPVIPSYVRCKRCGHTDRLRFE